MIEHDEQVLTLEEWRDGEFESHFGKARTSLQVDHEGRIFAHSDGPGDEDGEVVILNEAADAPVVLLKVMALCNRELASVGRGLTRRTLQMLGMGIPGRGGYFEIEWTEAEVREANEELAKIAALLPPGER